MRGEQRVVLSGDQAFAYAARDAGVAWVTGYPGSPSAGTLEALARMTRPAGPRVSWAINEAIAMESAFGASLAGARSLLCVKSVGLNVALDPLMTMALTGCHAGLVILLGDDPGGWASQNEQDTRILAVMADLPMLEPSNVQEAYDLLRYAFDLSERRGLPVIVRELRALSLSKGPVDLGEPAVPRTAGFVRERMRWISLPENVVRNHRRLHDRLADIAGEFEDCPFNRVTGEGRLGVAAFGADHAKLLNAVATERLDGFRVLKLSTFNPLPMAFLAAYLGQVDSVLVLEEPEAYLEERLSAAAQTMGAPVRLLGRGTGHVPVGGELDERSIFDALMRYAPDRLEPAKAPEPASRSMPSQKPLCSDCPYLPLFEALLREIDGLGGRERAIVVGEPGCMVRAQLPPMELMDVKYSLGSSLGVAAGLAGSNPGQKVVALTGDSSFLHHGWGGLVEAARSRLDLMVIVLDNGATALTGGQPHAGTPYDVSGEPAAAIDLAGLIREVTGSPPRIIDPGDGDDVRSTLNDALRANGLSVIVCRKPCPRVGTKA